MEAQGCLATANTFISSDANEHDNCMWLLGISFIDIYPRPYMKVWLQLCLPL
jgi:hypothetical protein